MTYITAAAAVLAALSIAGPAMAQTPTIKAYTSIRNIIAPGVFSVERTLVSSNGSKPVVISYIINCPKNEESYYHHGQGRLTTRQITGRLSSTFCKRHYGGYS